MVRTGWPAVTSKAAMEGLPNSSKAPAKRKRPSAERARLESEEKVEAVKAATAGEDGIVIFPGIFGSPIDPSTPLEDRNVAQLGTGLWNRVLIDATVNMDFAPAGTITGTVYKPGGTEILTPSNNQWIWVDAGTNISWTGSQLQKDGTFKMTDALPGVNRITLHVSGGNFNYTLPMPQPTVVVTEGSESTVNLTLVKSNYVGIVASMTYLPDTTVLMSGDGRDAMLGFKVIPLPAGTVLKGETISRMLTGGDEEGMRIGYSPATGPSQEGRCGNNWPGGFCGTAFPSPSVYDFYLMRAGDFAKSSNTVVDAPYPHFTLISSSKNVIIDDTKAVYPVMVAYTMGVSTGVRVNLTPATNMSARGNATLRGSISAANFFRLGSARNGEGADDISG